MSAAFIYQGPTEERLDKALLGLLGENQETSRSQLKLWIEQGLVQINGKVCTKPGTLIRTGTQVEVKAPVRTLSVIIPEDIPISVLYEDAELLVIDKQPNFVVHPGAGVKRGTLVHALASHFAKQGISTLPERMGIVHRLDKDTTGVLVVCKTEKSLRIVSEQFAKRTVKKFYTALIFTTPRGKQIVSRSDAGEIETAIGRHPTIRTRMAVVADGGRVAKTKWSIIERYTYGALLSIEILTGRTHQIRVHMEHIKCPIVGDEQYGTFSGMPPQLKRIAEIFGRQALHASEITLVHPKTGKNMTFRAPLPKDFQKLIATFRGE